MANELELRGVPRAHIARERCSLSTWDNARFVAEVPRSNPSVVMATFQPLFTPPMTLFVGQRTLLKKTSLNSAEPSICSIGRTSTPGCFIGTRR